MLIDGVDVREVLLQQTRNPIPSTAYQRLKDFQRGDTGKAFSDGVLALYVLLESFETSPEQAKLKATFGAMRMAAELATGHYTGFDHVDQLLGVERASELRQACAKGQCQYRGRQFMIQNSGLFDMLSTQGKPIKIGDSSTEFCQKSSAREVQTTPTASSAQESSTDGDCHGCCGPQCWGCTGIWTDECWGHDSCVRDHGHLACLFDSPVGNSLVDAIGSFLGAIGELIGDLFGFVAGGGGCDTFIVCGPDDWEDFTDPL
ncbi:hypothetical protein [Permianibacter aggregans]|uniref:Uncharacterized protein n=1 Tax=Permianibacter aggregans TaxID=1510150 RepID=A0A4R6US93_9GAMM|nr:hypothetical protein [Permianibacter aggregans]QGX41116.1 hypothetical protein E2H98_16160 [Permianibacter aggregans]TDQ48185.1 hypothetical protein EV696_108165 [Permianibacter aggregans]